MPLCEGPYLVLVCECPYLVGSLLGCFSFAQLGLHGPEHLRTAGEFGEKGTITLLDRIIAAMHLGSDDGVSRYSD